MTDEFRDLTEPDLMMMAFAEAPVGVLVLSNRRILKVNREIEALFGWCGADIEGQSIRVLYPTNVDFETTGQRWYRWLEAQPHYEDERFMRKKDGEIVWMRARGRTLTPDVPFRMMIWTFEPIADRKHSGALLTSRERDVARRIVNGQTSKETANELGISPRTIEVHRASIMRKLGVRNAAELATKFIVQR